MRALVVLALALVTSQARATLIEVGIHMDIIQTASTWLLGGPMPSTVNGSFLMDTSSFNLELGAGPVFPGDPTPYVFNMFARGMPTSNIRFSADGMDLWVGDSGLGTVFARAVSAFGYEGGLQVADGGRTFGDQDNRLSGSALFRLADFLASPDPIADVIVKWDHPSFPQLIGEWGMLRGQNATATIASIPEPDQLALLCGGLACLVVAARRRSAPARA